MREVAWMHTMMRQKVLEWHSGQSFFSSVLHGGNVSLISDWFSRDVGNADFFFFKDENLLTFKSWQLILIKIILQVKQDTSVSSVQAWHLALRDLWYTWYKKRECQVLICPDGSKLLGWTLQLDEGHLHLFPPPSLLYPTLSISVFWAVENT